MRCKNCRFWLRQNQSIHDMGYCEQLSGNKQVAVLAAMPIYKGDRADTAYGDPSPDYDAWLTKTDLDRMETGAHFGCVHFEPKAPGK
jgi:hypothetical protein